MDPAKVTTFYLILMSFVYLWAFSSLYFQIPGLYGDNGLMPVRSELKCEFRNQSQCAFSGEKPSILHYFVANLKLSPSGAMELACILGIIGSALSAIFGCFRDCTIYGLLWYLYFSCFQVGQTFLWYQWDTLLLETGFLTMIVAPCRIYRRLMFGRGSEKWLPYDNVNLYLIRWLAFRFLFASGVVKLTADCPTWWGLTALHYHFESQCIPTWPAWYAHVWIPDWFKKLSVVATFVIEIFLPVFFLVPVRRLRQAAFWAQVLLMILIMVTGNYNFFNALTIAICLPMLVDMDGRSMIGTHNFKNIIGRRLYNAISSISTIVGLAYVVHWTIEFFGVHWDGKSFAIESKIMFTRSEFDSLLSWGMSRLLVIGSVCFMVEVFVAFIRCFTDIQAKGIFGVTKRFTAFVHCGFICALATTMFAISLVPISWLHRDTYAKLWPELPQLYRTVDKYQLSTSYGLFRSMTGVGGRPEVVIEGASDMAGPWKEYEFLYKVGTLDRQPPIIIPHQARLDWQMWFAALDSFDRIPWFSCLLYRLLTHERDVLYLMDMEKVPFGGKKPAVKYIRAKSYLYHYTTDSPLDKHYHSKKNWWWREFDRDFSPILSLDNAEFIHFVKRIGCLVEKAPVKRTRLRNWLTFLRDFTELFGRAEYFIWSLTVIVLLLIGLKPRYFE